MSNQPWTPVTPEMRIGALKARVTSLNATIATLEAAYREYHERGRRLLNMLARPLTCSVCGREGWIFRTREGNLFDATEEFVSHTEACGGYGGSDD